MTSIPQLPAPCSYLPRFVNSENLTEFRKFEKDREPLFYVDMPKLFNNNVLRDDIDNLR